MLQQLATRKSHDIIIIVIVMILVASCKEQIAGLAYLIKLRSKKNGSNLEMSASILVPVL